MSFNFAFPQLPLTSHKCMRLCLEIIVLVSRGHLQARLVGSPRHQVPPPPYASSGEGSRMRGAPSSLARRRTPMGGLREEWVRKSRSLSLLRSRPGRDTESEQSLPRCDEPRQRPAEWDGVYTAACSSCEAAARCHRAGFYFSPECGICVAPSPGDAVHTGWAVRVVSTPPGGERPSRSRQAPRTGGPRFVRSPEKVPRLHR